jgi:hypothetical protein
VLAGSTTIPLPIAAGRAVDPKQASPYIVFCDAAGGKVDAFLGVPADSADLIKYITPTRSSPVTPSWN